MGASAVAESVDAEQVPVWTRQRSARRADWWLIDATGMEVAICNMTQYGSGSNCVSGQMPGMRERRRRQEVMAWTSHGAARLRSQLMVGRKLTVQESTKLGAVPYPVVDALAYLWCIRSRSLSGLRVSVSETCSW